MASTSLINNVRTMIRRYEGHLESGDHVLREGSQQEIGHSKVAYFREIDPETNQPYTNGYYVGPGGIGKTIIDGDFIVGINTMPNGRYVLGDPVLGKRVLITVPTNSLADRWGDGLLGEMNEETGTREPSVFGDRFTEDDVGIYHAELSDEEKEIVISKPVIIIVHDSARILYDHIDPQTLRHAPLLKPEDFDVVLIDEVDDKVRGDATGRFFKDIFFPNCLIIGCTATHLFRSGRTIGDYLFGGKKPICEITHEEGVKRREIAPHINIIVEPEVDPTPIVQPRIKQWEDYTEAQQMYFIEQTGTDNALLEVIKVGRHPKTGKPLREMMQLHKAVNVEHGKRIAMQLNDEFGSNYAEVVWGKTDGDMDDELRRLIKWYFTTNEVKAVVQCKLWGRGSDFPALEMTVQHAPSLSPNQTVQFHTRASRRHDGSKTAIYLSPYIQGIDQLIIGEMLGGLYMLPDGYEFPPTEGQHNTPSNPDPWPEIRGVRVHYTQRQLEMFAAERRRQRYVNGLPIKPRHMMNLEETALLLSIDRNLLRERVFSPLQEAYEKRQSRDKFVDVESGRQDELLHVRGKMFPVWRVGFYQQKGQEVFCVDRDLIPLCEHTLYGRLDKTPPEILSRANVKRLLGCNEAQIAELWQRLQYVFFHRRPYESRVEIDGINFSHDTFGFYRNPQGASEFFLYPDALIPAYRHLNKVNQETAERWAEQPVIRQCKTSSWLTESDVLEALELNPVLGHQETALVRNLFGDLRRQSRDLRTGQERNIEMGGEGIDRYGKSHGAGCHSPDLLVNLLSAFTKTRLNGSNKLWALKAPAIHDKEHTEEEGHALEIIQHFVSRYTWLQFFDTLILLHCNITPVKLWKTWGIWKKPCDLSYCWLRDDLVLPYTIASHTLRKNIMAQDTVFAIPCDHPAAKNGLFYCVPSYIESPHMRDDFEFIMLDTEKVIEHLHQRNPEMLKHAEYKFAGETVEGWLKVTSPRNPRDMGEWGYEYGVLSMKTGQAGMIKLVQELNLPCFPIAISKGYGADVRKDLSVFLGYNDQDINDFLDSNSIKKRQRAAAQDVLNARPRQPGEPIPLATYDPDWKTEFDAIQSQLEALRAEPYDEERADRTAELAEASREAFHSKFRTTADYAKWAEDRARDSLRYEDISGIKVPDFPVDKPVEEINRLSNLFLGRIETLRKIERNQVPLDYPTKGQPFSFELDSDETRTVETLSAGYQFPTINEIGDISGQETRQAPYSYVCEIRKDQINICFLQFGQDGPSPINRIEELATQVYNEKFGAGNIAAGAKYVRSESMNFYVYVPPTAYREDLTGVGLTWDRDELEFSNPEWKHQKSVPYVLRKLAAAEGLAKDPDAPAPPKRQSPSSAEDSPDL